MGARPTIEDCENAFGNSKVMGPIRRIRFDALGYRGVLPLVVINFTTLMVIGYFPWKDRGAAPNRRAMPVNRPRAPDYQAKHRRKNRGSDASNRRPA
jgi:hypothetical protein